jgi:hypothetical protein
LQERAAWEWLFQKVCLGVKIVLETDICMYCKELGTANFVLFEKKYMFCMLAYISFSTITFVCLHFVNRRKEIQYGSGGRKSSKTFLQKYGKA